MKATDRFKTVIENYLNQTAQNDAEFAQSFGKQTKNLENCFNYIFGEVRKTGLCAFEDQEIFDMAVKYYTDDAIGQPASVQCRVVVKQPAENDLFSCPSEIPLNAPDAQSTAALEDAEVLETVSAVENIDVGQGNIIMQDSTVVEKAADAQNSAAVQDNATTQDCVAVQDNAVTQNTAAVQDDAICKDIAAVQDRSIAQDTADMKNTAAVQSAAIPKKTEKSSKTAPKTLTLFDL